jgi:hypothetical protein
MDTIHRMTDEIFGDDLPTNSFVLFLDILGFSQKIEKIRTPGDFKPILVLLKYLKNTCKNYNDAQDILKDLKVQSVMDSIICSIPYNASVNGTPVAATVLIKIAIHLQNLLLTLPTPEIHLSRGYITEGIVFHDNELIVGPPYIKAYREERNIGNAPIIVVDKKIIQKAKEAEKQCVHDGQVSILDKLKIDTFDR